VASPRRAPARADVENTADGGRTLRIQLVRSVIGNPARQRATVHALGLRRIHQIVTHTDSPATRGMVARVPHLVRILEE
jgi:large subunit ribosomal protein L30